MTKKLLVLLLACVLCGSLVIEGCSNAGQEKTDEVSEAKVTEGTEAEVIGTEDTMAEVSQADMEDSITGKWILTDRNGQPVTTSEKVVYTFESADKALVSASLNSHEEAGAVWIDQLKADVAISGNKVTLTYSADDDTTSVHEYIITDITDKEYIAEHKGTVTKDGKDLLSLEDECRYVKVDADYSEDILGTWEGKCLTEKFVYNDGKAHRWEFKDDGTYVYYTKEESNWTPSNDTLNEYFVDGNLLCVRWVENGTENREWWEISIDGDKMNWTAFREDEDGNTFTATFEMNRVEKNAADLEVEEVYGVGGVVDETAVRSKYVDLTNDLIRNKTTITTMESCTSGQLASLITDTEGASAVLKGAFITYSNEAKIMQGVPEEIIKKYGVYSAETAVAMSEVCRKVMKADLGVGVTGSFGNVDPNNADSNPGEVWFAIATKDGTRCYHCSVPEQPSRLAYKLYMSDVIADKLLMLF